MRRIRDEEGISIVFIEQNVELALRLADRGYILESGRTILDRRLGGAAPVRRGQAHLPGRRRPIKSARQGASTDPLPLGRG